MKKRVNWKKVIGIFVFATIFLSIGYSIANIISAPESTTVTDSATHLRSDYVLMLIQCCLGLLVIGLPSALERKWSFELPNYMSILYFIFLYCAIYLGEVRNFYYLVPHWDTILHAFSGAMLGALGFTLVRILNDSDKVKVALSPSFICLFAFCFALAVGAIWEIYEFTGDALFGLNMQKFRLSDGTELIGHSALSDTMKDIIIDAIGAFIVTFIGYLSLLAKMKYKNKHGDKDSDE
ncbi:MAG: hypothetical protein IJP38_03445 [Oscillospiraceae bacterium]|nr:hypothetical protein [Oscillospiraceae bacterium]